MILKSLLLLSFLYLINTKDCPKTLMYYFHSSRMACFPILTNKCTIGNEERFNTNEECSRRRIPMDFNMCAANSPSIKRSNGESHCFIEGPEADNTKCPEGSICNYGFRVGICCDKNIEDRYNEEAKATCPNGKKFVVNPNSDFGRPFFGKECSHEFCPSDSKCQQGKYLAWCCK